MAEFYIFNNGLMTSNTMSGSDQRALNWSRIFSEHNHKINIFTSCSGAARFNALGFNVYITGKRYLKSSIGLFFTCLSRAIKSCFLQNKIIFEDEGIIYSSSDLLADVCPAIYMKLKNNSFKLIVGMHLIAPNPFKGFKKIYAKGFRIPSPSNVYYFIFQRMLLLILKTKASLILVSNKADRLFLMKNGFSQSNILVSYGACDISCINSVVAQDKRYDAIYVGRFHEQKGFPDLLKIWSKVVKELPDVKLIILGEDIGAGDIELLIRENKLEHNTEFLGYVGGEKKYHYFKSSKICIFPSYYESFGMVALEAMASGIPVIAYDLPVFREIYTKGMVRASIGDIAQMTKNVIDLIVNDNKREIISQEALELSRQFTWGKTAQAILKTVGL